MEIWLRWEEISLSLLPTFCFFFLGFWAGVGDCKSMGLVWIGWWIFTPLEITPFFLLLPFFCFYIQKAIVDAFFGKLKCRVKGGEVVRNLGKEKVKERFSWQNGAEVEIPKD